MGLQISAMILTEWLLIAAWFSENIFYNLGAIFVVILWGISWRNDKPRWPGNKLLRAVIYIFFGFLTGCVFIITKSLFSFLAMILIGIFMIVDFANSEEPS